MVHCRPDKQENARAPDWKLLQAKKIADECAIGIKVEPPCTSTPEQICLITMFTQALIIKPPKGCQHLFDQVLISAPALAVSKGNAEGFGHPLPASSMTGYGELKEIFLGHLKCARISVTQDGFSCAAQSQYRWQAQSFCIDVRERCSESCKLD